MDNRLPQPENNNRKKVTMHNPLVSIITPVFNGIKYLEICIQSVLNQSYPRIEHILVDGGSSDGTLEMLTSYQTKYPERIRFISEPDRSAGEAWNKGLKMARGEIFGWLGADDTCELDAVMTVVEFFRATPGACFVFGGCNYINEQGKVIGKAIARDFNLREAINDACYIPCPSAFYRREVVEKVGYLDTRETGVELDYWIRVGKLFPIHRIDTVLSNFRWHSGGLTGSKRAARLYAREGFVVSRRHGGGFLSLRAMRYYIYQARVFDWVFPLVAPVYRLIKRTNKQ